MTFALATEGFHVFIVCEAGPLVTIGQENAFSSLRCPPLPVIIPDVIYLDAIGRQASPDNPVSITAVHEWVRDNDDCVRIEPTHAGLHHSMLYRLDAGEPSQADTAMMETVDSFLAGSADQRAILILDDPASLLIRTGSRLLLASIDDFLDISRNR